MQTHPRHFFQPAMTLAALVLNLSLNQPAKAGSSIIADPIITGRYLHTATLLPDGKVLVIGGFNKVNLSSAELFDPTMGKWAATDAMITNRSEEHTSELQSRQ